MNPIQIASMRRQAGNMVVTDLAGVEHPVPAEGLLLEAASPLTLPGGDTVTARPGSSWIRFRMRPDMTVELLGAR